MRSESLSTSSKSAEMSSTAHPASRWATIWLWMNSVAPMSRPRVGYTATSRDGLPSSSRARMTFCWLPPESERAVWLTDVQRMSFSWRLRSANSAMAPILSQAPWPAEKRSESVCLSTRFSATVMSPTRPILLRSSGMLPRPERMNDSGEKMAILEPSGPETTPDSGATRPVTSAARGDWPLPSMPATPRISPRWMVSDTSLRPPCLTSGW